MPQNPPAEISLKTYNVKMEDNGVYIFIEWRSIMTSNTNMSTSVSTIYTFTVRKSAVRKILMHMHKQGL
jgi:hypothetical protein